MENIQQSSGFNFCGTVARFGRMTGAGVVQFDAPYSESHGVFDTDLLPNGESLQNLTRGQRVKGRAAPFGKKYKIIELQLE